MSIHAIFTAPFFMDATLHFIAGAAGLPGVSLSVISQDPVERLPDEIRAGLAGHWRVDDALDPGQIVHATQELQQRFGKATRLIAALEQLQVPLAVAREQLGIEGLSAAAALNFRDKSRMKNMLREAGVPCARHALVSDRRDAEAFAAKVGFPVVVKPPAGAGGKSTFRLDRDSDLQQFLHAYPPDVDYPTLYEEFVRGTEYSFDSVMIAGKPVWHSISRYMPSPLEVLENDWIQWCVMLPRDINDTFFDPIRDAAFKGLHALGLQTGLSHMEWFRLADGRIAISEVGARPPGAQITSLLSYAHDIDFYRAWPQLMVFDEFEPPPRRYAAGAAYIRGQGRGRVSRIHGLDEAQRRFGAIVVEAKLPREGQPPSDSYEGDGYIIVRHPETDVVEHALQEIVKTIRVELA
ncbi:MAG: ATP-grasp domain-containing protein [Gammaproteobacteria bacterium]|nr:ATP-grasp domain-containing protein [Gammaproteobacteria bacterium]